MPAETAQGEPRVIVVASATAERCAQVCRALGAAGIDVVRLPDVYLAIGEIVANNQPPPQAVVVQAACLETSEMEFFPLSARLIRGGLYVFGESSAEEGLLRAAVAAGATKLDMSALTEWAEALADTPVETQTDNIPETRHTTEEPAFKPADIFVAPPIPQPPPEEPAETPLQDMEPVEECEPEPEIAETAEIAPAETPAPPVEDSQPVSEAPPIAPEPLPTPDLRVARPIALPHEWPLRTASSKTNGGNQPEDDSGIPAVPWRPPAGRPTRTPPTARAAGPIIPNRLADDAELTRDELNALLGDPTDTPESRRHNR